MRYIYIAFLYMITLVSVGLCTYTSSFYETARSTCGNATLSDIRTLLREELNDPSNSYSTNRYTDTELNKYINIAYEDLCLQTQCLHSSATGQMTAGTTFYYLPTNFLAIERVIFATSTLLGVANVYDMDVNSSGWFDTSTSSPTVYYQYPGYETIGFYPCPKYTGGKIEIWYIKKPTTLSSDTDEIFDSIPLLNSFRRGIVVGAAYMLFLQENDSRSNIKVTEYQNYIEAIKKYFYFVPAYQYKARLYKK